MEIEASTTYDLETCRAMCRTRVFSRHDPGRRIVWMNAAYIPVVAACAALAVLGRGALYWVLAAVLAAVTAVTDLSYALMPKYMYKSLGELRGAKLRYKFGDTAFTAAAGDAAGEGGSTEYAELANAMETPRYLFLYRTAGKALPVDKNTMTPDGMTALREKLRYALGERYIVRG